MFKQRSARRTSSPRKPSPKTPQVTEYQGVVYKSRIEAVWARIFHTLGWEFAYEPADPGVGIWNPDFFIRGSEDVGYVMVEVKAARTGHDAVIIRKMESDRNHKLDRQRDSIMSVWNTFPTLRNTGPSDMRLGRIAVWDSFTGMHQKWLWGDARLKYNPYGLNREKRMGRFEIIHVPTNLELMWEPRVINPSKNWWGEDIPVEA